MSARQPWAPASSIALVLAACSPQPEPEPAPAWPGRCAPGVEAGAPTQIAWSIVDRWDRPPTYRALPDGAVVIVGQMDSESASEEPWIDVRVLEPDGSERWRDRYDGYVGYDAWASGVSVDSDGNIHVSGLDIHSSVSRGPNTDGELLHDQLLIRWSARGERRFRARTPPCGEGGGGPALGILADGGGGPGLGIAADGRLYTTGVLAADMTTVCIHVYSPTGEPESVLTADVPDHAPYIQPITQWDGSFLISGSTPDGSDHEILAHYGPSGEQLWAHYGQSAFVLLPGLVGDGRTVVGHRVQDDMHDVRPQAWMLDSKGELVWAADGRPYGVNCAGEVIVRRLSGSFALHDPDDGGMLHEWSLVLPGDWGNSDHWSEFIPSPDGAVYVSYPVGADEFGVARLEPE